MPDKKNEVEVSKERQIEILEAMIARDLFEMKLVIGYDLVNDLMLKLKEKSSTILIPEKELVALYKKVLLKKTTGLLS